MTNTVEKTILCLIVLLFLIMTHIGVFRVELADAPNVDNLYGGKYIYLTVLGTVAVIMCTTLYLFRFYTILSMLAHAVATLQMAILFSFWGLFFFRRISIYTKDEMKKMHGGVTGIIRQFPRHLVPFIVISCYLIEIDRAPTSLDYIFALFLSVSYITWVRYTNTINNKYPYPFLNQFEHPLKMYGLSLIAATVFFIITAYYNSFIQVSYKRLSGRGDTTTKID
ncbi:hypothetical protein CDIK_0924 [Cucumispora dikerogammari]|nr:hypothetical protein CDIK_0924 [Cucumispora dikerogammari]